MDMKIATKSIYDPSSAADGYRVLVTRLWPRGVKKNRVKLWLRELSPEYPVLKAFKAGKISWGEFAKKYKAGLKKAAAKDQMKELKSIARKKKTTILCVCREEAHCHRSILKTHLK